MDPPPVDPSRLTLRLRAEVPVVPADGRPEVEYRADIFLLDEKETEPVNVAEALSDAFQTLETAAGGRAAVAAGEGDARRASADPDRVPGGRRVGFIAYRVVEVRFDPDSDNEPSFDLLDALDCDAEHLGQTMRGHLDDFGPDGVTGLLILDRVWIDPEHRGRGVASRALSRVLKLFDGAAVPDHAVASLYAWDARTPEGAWERFEKKDPAEFKRRLARLHAWSARIGFERMGETDVVWRRLRRGGRGGQRYRGR